MPRTEDEFQYTTVNRSGNVTEDKEKITKVIAFLKSSTARKGTILGKQLEDLLKKKEEVDKDLGEIKEKVRPFVQEIFDTEDEIWTRVIETAKVIVTMSKATTRHNFNKDKFLEKIVAEFPELSKRFDEIVKECTSIANVASKLDVELKSEGIGDSLKNLFNILKNEVSRVVKGIKNYLTGYDKKLESWKEDLQKNIEVGVQDENPGEAVPAVESVKVEHNKYITEANKWVGK